MTSADRTIYRHVKRSHTTKELIKAYTSTEMDVYKDASVYTLQPS